MNQTIKHTIFIALFYLITLPMAFGNTITIQGHVYDASLGIPIYNANIELIAENSGTTTDSSGFFRLKIQKRLPAYLTVSHIAYFPETVIVKQKEIIINLNPHSILTQAVEVARDFHVENRDITAPKITISASQLEIKAVHDFEEIARSSSSISIQSSSDGSKTLSIRGSNPNEIPVFVDGVRINDSFSNIADFSTINLQDISAMNIIKGPSTLTHGSGAFGGVVDIINKLDQVNKASLATSFDINNVINSTQFVHLSLFKFNTSLNYAYSNRIRKYVNIMENTNNSQQLSLGYSGQNFSLLGKYHAQTKDVRIDTFNTVPLDNNTYLSFNANGRLPGLGDGWDANIIYRKNDFSSPFWDYNMNKTFYSQKTQSNEQSHQLQKIFNGKSLETTLQIESGHKLFTGPSQMVNSDLYSWYEQLDLKQDTKAVLAITKWTIQTGIPELESLKLEYGFRYDENDIQYANHIEKNYYANTGTDTTYITTIKNIKHETAYHFKSKQLGFSLKGSVQNLSYTFVFSQGHNYRTPTLQDLFQNHTNTVLAYQNIPLEAELINSNDLLIKLSYIPKDKILFSSYTMEADIFTNNFTNKLSYHYAPAQPPLPYNTLDSKIEGYEISATLGAIKDPLSISLNTTQLDLSDPVVFANKSASRNSINLHAQKNNFHFNWIYWSESPQHIPLSVQRLSDPITNQDLSFSYQKQFYRFYINTGLAFKNLLSKNTTNFTEQQLYYLPYDETFRSIFSLKISFE